MPKIIEYAGIIIYIFTNDHEPMHVHARYGDAEIKVSFFLKNGKIYRTTYTPTHGKMPPAKLRTIKKLCAAYQYIIIERWIDIHVNGMTKIKLIKIDKNNK